MVQTVDRHQNRNSARATPQGHGEFVSIPRDELESEKKGMGRGGGYGRLTVSDCLAFDAVLLRQTGVFKSLPGTQYVYEWRRASRSDCKMSYTVIEVPAVAMALGLDYFVSDERSMTKQRMGYVVKVTSTGCRLGGRRFWLRCPMQRNGVPCDREVLRLYLPPGGLMFGCRHCHNLTYRSCQDHDKRVDALARDPFAVEMALKSPSPKLVSLGVRAYNRLEWWMNRYGRLPQRRRRHSPAEQAPNLRRLPYETPREIL